MREEQQIRHALRILKQTKEVDGRIGKPYVEKLNPLIDMLHWILEEPSGFAEAYQQVRGMETTESN